MSRLALAVEKQAARPAGTAETALARLAQADRALAEAIEVASAVNLVSTAKALSEWASGTEYEHRASVFVLRAMRNAGERIAQAQARGDIASPVPSRLADVGISRDQSSQWKRLAAMYPTGASLSAALGTMARPSLASALRASHREAASERIFVDGIVAGLASGGIACDREVPFLTGRADIVIWCGPRNPWVIVEAKVADPLAGVGQVLGYCIGSGAMPALATPAFLRTPRLLAACEAAGVVLVHDAGAIVDVIDRMWGEAT